jgi:Zn ribbon nucleic-acid-binding protein
VIVFDSVEAWEKDTVEIEVCSEAGASVDDIPEAVSTQLKAKG